MSLQRCLAVLAAVAVAPTVCAQQSVRIGYVYPAGGQQGASFEAVVAGQFLNGVDKIHVSGQGVGAEIVQMIRPISGKELNDLRIAVDELLARRAVVRDDFRALAQFRSFQNAKDVKPDAEAERKATEELKKKYAGAKWTAEDEAKLTEARKKISSGVRRPANPAISELVILKVTIAADARPGQRELRLATPQALSNPLVFHVGQLAEFSEAPSKEIAQQRSQIAGTAFLPKRAKADEVPEIKLPTIVNGQILPGEVDRYRFTARRGQRLVVSANARELVPYVPDAVPGWFQATLALFDANGKELAYDDDYRFNPDPVLLYRIPADGEYAVEIKDAIYRGREDFVYRFAIGELPFVTNMFPLGGPAGATTQVRISGWNIAAGDRKIDNTAQLPGVRRISVGTEKSAQQGVPFAVDSLPEMLETEPNNQPERAEPLTAPIIVNGRIGQADDVDVYSFTGRAGAEIVAEVHARRLNSPLDARLKLSDAAGNVVAANDDHDDKAAGLMTHHADPYLRAKLPADGTYYLRIADTQHKGGAEFGYRLRLSPPRPDFQLRVVPSSLTVRRGLTVPLTVYALRRDGFAGEIELAAVDAPAGVAIRGGRIPGTEDKLRLTLTVPSSMEDETFALTLRGRAVVDGREIVRPAVPAEDMMQAFEYRHLVPVRELLVANIGKAYYGGVKVVAESPLRIPAGGTASLRLVAGSARLGQMGMEVFEPAEGLSVKDVSPSRQGAEIVVQSDAGCMKPGQKGNLIIALSPDRGGGSSKKKPQAGVRRGPPVATLPAIPFEVVAP